MKILHLGMSAVKALLRCRLTTMTFSGRILSIISTVLPHQKKLAEARVRLVDREAKLATTRAKLISAYILIEHYKVQLANLCRIYFGRSLKKLDRAN